MSSMKERMLSGEPYLAGDAELVRERARCQALLERDRLLRELLGEVGDVVAVGNPARVQREI